MAYSITFLARGRLRQLAHRDHVGAALDQLLDLQADLAQVHVEVLEHVGPDPRAFLDQPEQDVLGADVFVVEPLGLLVGQGHHLPRPIGEAFEHLCSDSSRRIIRSHATRVARVQTGDRVFDAGHQAASPTASVG
jgi:hypothetical protein